MLAGISKIKIPEVRVLAEISKLEIPEVRVLAEISKSKKGYLNPLPFLSSPSPVYKTGFKSPRVQGWNVKLI